MLNHIINYNKCLYQFITFVIKQFIKDACLLRAGALTYTSLLSLVPLMVVIASTLSIFSVFVDYRNMSVRVQKFIFNHFIPETGQQIYNILGQVEHQASKLPIVGIIFLFITALMLMISIDNIVNHILFSSKKRSFRVSLLIYWATLTLAPVLLGGSLVMSSYVYSLKFLNLYNFTLIYKALNPLAFLLSVIGFSFFYIIVPHGRINWLHGLLGGFFSGVLFAFAKYLFTYYVIIFSSYKVLYGSLAIIPLFLIWVYVSWIIFLIGAEMVNGLRYQSYRQLQNIPFFLIAYLILFYLWQAQNRRQCLSAERLVRLLPLSDPKLFYQILSQLLKLHYIVRCDNDTLSLSCDLHLLSLEELQQTLELTVSCHSVKPYSCTLTMLQPLLTTLMNNELIIKKVPLIQLYSQAIKDY